MNNKIEIEVTTQEQKERLIKFFESTKSQSLFNESHLEQLNSMEIERKLPKTWEEYLYFTGYHESSNVGISTELYRLFKSSERNHLIAVQKLRELRDYYNNGWKADFTYSDDKYSLILIDDNICLHLNVSKSDFLVFKTKEIAEQFKENFKDLIKEYYDTM